MRRWKKNQVTVGSVTVAIKMQNLWRTNKNEAFMCDCYSYVKIKGDAHIACVVQFYPLSLINLMKNETINCFGFPETHTSVSSLSQSVLYPITRYCCH